MPTSQHTARNESVDSAEIELRVRSTTLPSARAQLLLRAVAPVPGSPIPIEEALQALVDLADAAAIVVPDTIAGCADAAVAAIDLTLVMGSQMRPDYASAGKIVDVVDLATFGTPSSRLPDHLAASVRLNRPAELVDFRRITIDVLEHVDDG